MKTSTEEIEKRSIEQSIEVDLILLVHKNMPGVLIGNSIGSLPLAAVMWNEGVHVPVLVWLLLHFATIMLRAVHHYSFKPQFASTQEVFRYGHSNLWLIALAGGVWGLAGILFFDPKIVSAYSFLILTLLAMISGSMNAISSVPRAYYFFSSFTMLPIIIISAVQGTSFYIMMSIASSVYWIMNISFSQNTGQSIRESLGLKYQNIALVEDLKTQTEFANKANHDKSQFLAAASHDIRQPLHAANLFVDAMELEVNTDNQRYILGGIRRGMDTVGELFDGLLDISSIDTNVTPVTKSGFYLDELLGNLVTSLQIDARRKGIKLTYYDCDFHVYTDRILLERVLSNLITNAINYTNQGSVEVFAECEGEHKLRLHIRDTGIGIKLEERESIFDEFVQLNNPERDRRKGLGLGLAIVRRLTNLLEIPMIMASEVDQGTDFVLELFICNPEQEQKQSKPRSNQNSQLEGLSVLIVDNEADIILGLTLVLKNWGCKVMSAGSSEEAIKRVSEANPDFVISDFRMPGVLDGIDLINEIRATNPDIKGLIISGDTGQEIIQKSQNHQVILLKKPVKPVQLNMAISRLIRQQGVS